MKDKLWTTFSKLIPLIGLVLFVYLICSINPFKIWDQLTKIKIGYFVLFSLFILPSFVCLVILLFNRDKQGEKTYEF